MMIMVMTMVIISDMARMIILITTMMSIMTCASVIISTLSVEDDNDDMASMKMKQKIPVPV